MTRTQLVQTIEHCGVVAVIRLRDPKLPEFLNEVVLRDLKLGPSSVDLRLRRHDGEVSLEVLRTRGQIQVSIVLTH